MEVYIFKYVKYTKLISNNGIAVFKVTFIKIFALCFSINSLASLGVAVKTIIFV